jgi:cellulose synthase/poly-beta-1,6-N-acetylglucosamine synthase-like glycosyltransferase
MDISGIVELAWGLAFFLYLSGVFLLYWKNEKEMKRQQNWGFQGELPNVSILIAFRNEAPNLEKLVSGLMAQDYPSEKLEIILVDDHSEDDSFRILNEMAEGKSDSVKVLALPSGFSGKKAALNFGKIQATSDVLLFTDADVHLPENWVRSMLACMQNSQADMVCGEVKVLDYGNIGAPFESLEFASLVAVSAGTAAAGYPILCNGASYLVTREALDSIVFPEEWSKVPGGDDIFLLHGLSKLGRKIAYCRMPDSAVSVKPAVSVSGFISQRLRWASKAFTAGSAGNLLPASLLWFFHLGFVVFVFSCLLEGKTTILLWTFCLRATAETLLLKDFLPKPGFRENASRILIFQVFYSFYFLFSGLAVLFFRKFTWKGRVYG